MNGTFTESIARDAQTVNPTDEWESADESPTNGDTAAEAESSVESPYPPLPADGWLDPALGVGAGAWLDAYVDHASKVSPMTPRLFHESAGLHLASTAIARRLKVPMGYGDVYPNLYVVWIAGTTLWHKTTAMNYAQSLARRAFPHLLGPQEWTTEALLSDLAGLAPTGFEKLPDADRAVWQDGRDFAGQRGLYLDELSGLLAAAGKDYNAGLIETLLKLYDCPPDHRRLTRNQGLVVIHNAYVSLLGASTPSALAPHLANELLLSNGWWARFALLTPEVSQPTWAEAEPGDEPPELLRQLQRLYDRLPKPSYPEPPKALRVSLGAGVLDAWKRYDRAVRFDLIVAGLDDRLHGVYGRIPAQALKIATILAALDWPDEELAPRVELSHLARAIQIAESWRASAHRILTSAAGDDSRALMRRVLKHIGGLTARNPDGPSRRELHRAMQNVPPAVIDAEVDRLIEIGIVLERLVATRGKSAKRLRLTPN